MKNLTKIEDLESGTDFFDAELYDNENLTFEIVEDHVFIIYKDFSTLIIASDNGNGYGKVLEKKSFSSEDELVSFLNQDWGDYLHEKKFKAYFDMISF